MPQPTADQRDWIIRVLGVTLPQSGGAAGSPDPARLWRSARDAWQAASAAVDRQIGSLQSALRASENGLLKQIGDSDLNAVVGSNKDPLLAVIAEIGDGAGDRLDTERAKALSIVRAFRAHLANDLRVAACDQNPVGVAVSIRATLGGALAQMETALRT